jgi:hypothetical protein
MNDDFLTETINLTANLRAVNIKCAFACQSALKNSCIIKHRSAFVEKIFIGEIAFEADLSILIDK